MSNTEEKDQGMLPENEQEERAEEFVEELMKPFTRDDYLELNQVMMERAEAVLKQKYGMDFSATIIGDRFDSPDARIYLHPVEEESLVFTALLDSEGFVKDDFVSSIMLFRLKQDLLATLSEAGISGDVNCVFPRPIRNETDPGISPEDFLKKYPVDRVLMRLILPEGTDREAVQTALEDFSRTCPLDLMVNGFVLNEPGMEECRKIFAAYPSVSEDWIRKFNPSETFRLFVNKGKGTWIKE